MTLIQQELKKLNITGMDIQKVLRAALKNGGALAELFFEESASTRVVFEGGRVDKMIEGTDKGVGLRILFDNRSVYGYTTSLTEASLLALAEALSAAVTPGAKPDAKPQLLSSDIEWRVARQPQKEIA